MIIDTKAGQIVRAFEQVAFLAAQLNGALWAIAVLEDWSNRGLSHPINLILKGAAEDLRAALLQEQSHATTPHRS